MCVVLAVVYLFSFKGLVFTCSASRVVSSLPVKVNRFVYGQLGLFIFGEDFIRRSVGRESSIAEFSHCRNQRLACGDAVLAHEVSCGCFEDVHCLALLCCCCCCFHMRIISDTLLVVKPNL